MTGVASAAPFRVLISDHLAESGIRLLRNTRGFEVDLRPGLDPAALRKIIAEHDALIVRSATKVTAAIIDAAELLMVIGRAGTGVDNIDVAAATRAGVLVLNAPGANSIAAAELTLALMLALARKLPQASAALRAGRWERKQHTGVELFGKVLGILGLGRIGREVARRAQVFGLDVVGHDPCVPEALAADLGIRWLPLNDVVAQADFLTLHLPLTEQTHHLIDAQRLGRMKAGAFLINCARGGLVDERALLDTLQADHLAGAALDVYEAEPPQDLELLGHPRVVASPHLGASTREAQERAGAEIAEKVRDFLTTGRIADAINKPAPGS
jgi:D-3-phosphoglycerate dehydrogenase